MFEIIRMFRLIINKNLGFLVLTSITFLSLITKKLNSYCTSNTSIFGSLLSFFCHLTNHDNQGKGDQRKTRIKKPCQ